MAGYLSYRTETSASIESLARVQFYIYSLETSIDEQGDLSYKNIHTFVPAARCKDLYAANMTIGSDHFNEVLKLEFENKNEICPNITDLTLHQNPWMIKNVDGTNFV